MHYLVGKIYCKCRVFYFQGGFSEIIVYFKGLLIIVSLFYSILLITLACRKFGIAQNYALNLDGVKKVKFCKSVSLAEFPFQYPLFLESSSFQYMKII